MSDNGGSGDDENVILRGAFTFYPKNKPTYDTVLTSTHLTCTPQTPGASPKIKLSFDDILGCDCMKGKANQAAPDLKVYVTVYAYPYAKKFASKKTGRKRQTVTLTFSQHGSYFENHKDAMKWTSAIKCLARKIPLESIDDVGRLQAVPRKRLLILVNPFSGPGKALAQFQQRVVPILAEAEMHYLMKVTEYAGHARSLMRSLELTDWAGVVIVSGDGLLFEVVNGLMERPDWREAIKMPLGVLPGGSGNALVCSLLHARKEPYLDNMLLYASLLLVKHDVLPMDLVAVDLTGGSRIYSFLAIGWGIISDVDIESEKYRSMGGARFTAVAMVRLFNLRKYRGRLSFLPADPTNVGGLHRSHSLATTDVTPPSNPTRSQSMVDDLYKHMAPNRKPSQTQFDNPTGLVLDEAAEENVDEAQSENQVPPEGVTPSDGTADGAVPSAVPTPLLNPLTEPVPENWVTLEDDFILVCGVYQTHLSKDCIAMPRATINDGVIHLAFVRSNVTRMRAYQMFNDFQDGTILDNPDVEFIPVHAFRLEPLSPNGHLTVDGELVPYGPIQAQVLPSAARIMTCGSPVTPRNS